MALPLVTILGNVVAEPELRFTPSGKAVVNFRVAANKKREIDGKWEDVDSLFLSCSAWDMLAENVAESVPTGTAVIVYGELKQRSYENKEGVKVTVFELDARDVGISLRNASATVKKTTRERGVSTVETGGTQDDRPPF